MSDPLEKSAVVDIGVFAQNMKRQRMKQHITQKQLAEVCGIDLATINQIENIRYSSDRNPRISSLSAVARALGVSLSEMFQDTAAGEAKTPSYLTFSAWLWDKFDDCVKRLDNENLYSKEQELRRAFEGFLLFAKPDRNFSDPEKESIWNDRQHWLIETRHRSRPQES